MFIKLISVVLLSLPTWIMSCFHSNKVITPKNSEIMILNQSSFHTISAISLDGQLIPMEQYKGKKIIILNVASKCGYTPQYADWQTYYETNMENVVVLGFPCNQFMSQEPGNASEIATFCEKNYGVTFPMFEKVDVKGENQCEVYKWLTDPKQNGWNSEVPSWNFCKYLIDEDGKLTHFFASKIKPDSPEFLEAVK